jgi:hypothetical protein
MKVHIKKYGYQRNGICGEGFHYFKIEFREDNKLKTWAIATLTVECDEQGEYPEKFNGSCRVVTPDNLDCHWRGDQFETEIRKQHKLWFNYL